MNDVKSKVLNPAIERFAFSERITISVVIPHFYQSRRPNVDFMIEKLKMQTRQDFEVLLVKQISPQGKAINLGVRAAEGQILVVMDDDTQIDDPHLIEKLSNVMRDYPDVAMAGASLVSPENINGFQKAAAKQFPRFHMPIVNEVTDSDMACHGCVAFRRDVFESVGMERDSILRGLDPDLRVRIRRAGYRVVLVPNTWIYHPFPPSLVKFLRLFFRNGYGSSYTQVFHPEMSYDTDETIDSKKFVPKRSFLYRIFRFPLRLLKSIFTLQWIRFLGYFVYFFGYVVGYSRFSILKLTKGY